MLILNAFLKTSALLSHHLTHSIRMLPKFAIIPNAIERMKDEAEKILVSYRNVVPMEPLTLEEETNFHSVTTCHICKKELNMIPNFLLVFIHKLSSYDGHVIVRKLDYDERRIFVIPNTKKKYILFAKSIKNNFCNRFVDTCHFMQTSATLTLT
ncbi:hypothetical protein J437_LFUL016718 [Ladona fulva]|uniref:Uncharacterized protein n=1 Tax=Ladona fulva TaxID=123851 RepID=A0A8K0KMV9_LADFU|nr:hypothetical protein J437_LFUL016718 [Ladona fulva]